jgi:hypothetical protein
MRDTADRDQRATLLVRGLLMRCVTVVLLLVFLRVVFDGWMPEVVRWFKPVLGLIFIAWMHKLANSF